MRFGILEQRSFICSLIFHGLVFASSFISFFKDRPTNLLLMNVEFMGEGELQEIIEKQQNQFQEIPEEEIKEEKPQEAEQKVTEPVQSSEEMEGAKPEEKSQQEEHPKKENIEKTQEEPKSSEEESLLEQKKVNEAPKTKKKLKRKRLLKSIVKRVDKQKKSKEAAKKKSDDNFKKMMRDSIAKLPSSKQSSKKGGKGAKGSGAGAFGTGVGLSENDYEIIRSQIYPYWIVPAGVKDAENIIIEIRVKLRDNGEVSDIKVVDERRYNNDYVFRAAADSAKQAVLEASPLSIPKGKIDLFREFVFSFNLKETLGE